MTNLELLVGLVVQIGVIWGAGRVLGIVARAIGQPEVVGQMVAGLALGPSLLGHVFPNAHEWLFPASSRATMLCVAQVGLVGYMFVVGAEFRIDVLRHKARTAASISIAGIVVPFAVGALLGLGLCGRRDLFPQGVERIAAMVFWGTAMSITAFPVMASILSERGLAKTDIGTMLLAAGSINDAIAWCILAILLGLLGDGWWPAVMALGGAGLLAAGAPVLLRPLLRWIAGKELAQPGATNERVSIRRLLAVLAILGASAWYTNAIGIHAVFGAFVVGLMMPRGDFALSVRRALMPTVSAVLVPVFFASSGLNTRVTLVDTWELWGIGGLIVAGACVGKLVACAWAARWSGETMRDSLAIGSMMNARGLMELIILNVGLERGLITPTLYSMGVLMTVVTTLMATPMFDALHRRCSSPSVGA